MKTLDTATLEEIIKMIGDQQDSTNALFRGERESDLSDFWVFNNEYVQYGAHRALDILRYKLIDYLEEGFVGYEERFRKGE